MAIHAERMQLLGAKLFYLKTTTYIGLTRKKIMATKTAYICHNQLYTLFH